MCWGFPDLESELLGMVLPYDLTEAGKGSSPVPWCWKAESGDMGLVIEQ